MNYETILYEKKDVIATVTLNRPDKLNALSETLQLEVRDALEDAGWADDRIRVIVLKAAGRAFSAGFDISSDDGGSAVNWHDLMNGARDDAHSHPLHHNRPFLWLQEAHRG